MPHGHKNFLFVHLESISWQTLHAFPDSFPNLRRIMPGARRFLSYFSSATSTQMAMAFLLHGNDFELDAAPGLAEPAANNPSLLSILAAEGYSTEFLCVSAFGAGRMLPLLANSLPPVWSTDDFAELLAKFEAATAPRPFAIYVWNLVSHVDHATALESFSDGIDDMLGGAYAVADRILGALLDLLERDGLLDETAIVIFGDHGDDFWAHGFNHGMTHGMAPYTNVTHVPLLIRDPALPAADDHRLASTIDIAPTCLALAGIRAALPFPESGSSLVSGSGRDVCLSQNLTANQADAPRWNARKGFSANDGSYMLLVGAGGLELFNHRLDPTNHCNLLHFYDLVDGQLVPSIRGTRSTPHLTALLHFMGGGERAIPQHFKKLQGELKRWISKKERYVAERAKPPFRLLDPSRLDVINRQGRSAFFGEIDDAGVGAPPGARPRARGMLRKLKKAFLGKTRDARR